MGEEYSFKTRKDHRYRVNNNNKREMSMKGKSGKM